MQVFNVLDQDLDVHKSYLLEASAGTGKTFSIENIVTRLLLEPHPETKKTLTIDQILVVTFTRAATLDLKTRIRGCIEKAREFIQSILDGRPETCSAGYLTPYLDCENVVLKEAKRALDCALFSFDNAQIHTIHGFCSRTLRDHVLEGGLNICSNPEKSTCTTSVIIAAVRDFLRTGITSERYPPKLLKKLKSLFSKNLHKSFEESLFAELLRVIKQGLPIVPPKSPDQLLQEFQHVMQNELVYSSEDILHDFYLLAPSYNGLHSDGQLKLEVIEKIERFAKLFSLKKWTMNELEVLIDDEIAPLTLLSKLKAKPPEIKGTLKHPDLLKSLRAALLPISEQISPKHMVFSLLAYDCQQHILRYMNEEELFTFEDLLTTMRDSLKKTEMIDAVREKYEVAIIDEFQDTDPVQWEIFETLFMKSKKHLYLVGDPKQSIYAFRQADIYTYLSAKIALGEEQHASLNTNFRSTPDLVNGLNFLFDPQRVPGLIKLPRISQELPYTPVKYSEKVETVPFKDQLGAVHFCVGINEKNFNIEDGERQFFLPYFVQQIQSLHANVGICYKEMAILVSNHAQGDRVAKYLRDFHIPCSTQKSTYLSESKAPEALRELINAVIYPRNDSAVKVALGGAVIGWTHNQIHLLNDQIFYESTLQQFYSLRKLLFEEGVAPFFQYLLRSCWHFDEQSVSERILQRRNGAEFLTDLEQVIQLLLEYQLEKKTSPDALMGYLDEIKNTNDNDNFRRRSDPNQDAVNILTGHSSKGLEYSIVFALAVIHRSPEPKLLFPYFNNGETRMITVPTNNDECYHSFCEELDAEKMRQIYVIMTRAKHRLYVPVLQGKQKKIPKRGTASPMELYLARFGQSTSGSEELYERMVPGLSDTLVTIIRENANSKEITVDIFEDQQVVLTIDNGADFVPLTPPPKVSGFCKPMFMYSFSGLTKHVAGNIHIKLDDPPHDFHTEIKNPHTLPAGSETGNLLHVLFEKMEFSTLNEMSSYEELIPQVSTYTVNTRYKGWESVLAKMVWNVLTASFQSGVALKDVTKMYKEMEFLYPWDHSIDIEGIERRDGYLKGVIDLLFMHEDKYYLLDWKSNWLGGGDKAYTNENMITAMNEHQYFLQAKIYKKALQRYVSVIDNRPFDEVYGGTYYVFLRGTGDNGIVSFT